MNNYDIINVPLFKAGKYNSYLCSMCGQYTTLSNSVSHQGYNMICDHCLNKMVRILDHSPGELIVSLQREGERRRRAEENDNVTI